MKLSHLFTQLHTPTGNGQQLNNTSKYLDVGCTLSVFCAPCVHDGCVSYMALKSRVFTLPVKALEAIFER